MSVAERSSSRSLAIDGEQPPASSRPRILDSTLREGEQVFGHRLNGDEKVHVLRLLEAFGVDLIEVGHPAISADDLAICTRLAQVATTAELLVHARATAEEVAAAAATGAPWVGVWISATETSLKAKWSGRSASEILQIASNAVSEAKERGLRVRLTVEDASRTSPTLLQEICGVAEDGSVDVLSLADTVGMLTPTEVPRFVGLARDACDIPLEMHFHNDLGLALANAMSAIDAGVKVIDASILGLGERAGIVDLLQLTAVLALHRDDERWDLKRLGDLARAAAHFAGATVEPHRPLVGAHVWTHVSKYHQDAAHKDPSLYEPIEPRSVGGVRRFAGSRPPLGPPRLAESIEVGRPVPTSDKSLGEDADIGTHWTLLDGSVSGASQIYLSRQLVSAAESVVASENAWTERCRYVCPSALVFLGGDSDNKGLSCEVAWNDTVLTIASPATLWIPPGVSYRYRLASGSGEVLTIVLARYRECAVETNSDAELGEPLIMEPPWTAAESV